MMKMKIEKQGCKNFIDNKKKKKKKKGIRFFFRGNFKYSKIIFTVKGFFPVELSKPLFPVIKNLI